MGRFAQQKQILHSSTPSPGTHCLFGSFNLTGRQSPRSVTSPCSTPARFSQFANDALHALFPVSKGFPSAQHPSCAAVHKEEICRCQICQPDVPVTDELCSHGAALKGARAKRRNLFTGLSHAFSCKLRRSQFRLTAPPPCQNRFLSNDLNRCCANDATRTLGFWSNEVI